MPIQETFAKLAHLEKREKYENSFALALAVVASFITFGVEVKEVRASCVQPQNGRYYSSWEWPVHIIPCCCCYWNTFDDWQEVTVPRHHSSACDCPHNVQAYPECSSDVWMRWRDVQGGYNETSYMPDPPPGGWAVTAKPTKAERIECWCHDGNGHYEGQIECITNYSNEAAWRDAPCLPCGQSIPPCQD